MSRGLLTVATPWPPPLHQLAHSLSLKSFQLDVQQDGTNRQNDKGKGSSYLITERRVPELIPVLCSQPAGDVSHKPGGRLPLLSARPAVTPATLKSAATSFAAWRTEAQWVWTVCLILLPDSVKAAIWTQALLRLSPERYRASRQNDSCCVIFALCTTVLCRRALMRLIFDRSIVWLCHQLRLHFNVTQVSFTAHELNWSDLN